MEIVLQKFTIYMCNHYIPSAHRMITVSKGIAEEYQKEFRVTPIVMTNAPNFEDLQPTKVESPIRLIHHGLATKARNIESLIDMMNYLDESYELNLMLIPRDKAYYQRLVRLAAGFKNINFLTPVPMTEISSFLNQFDIGVILYKPVTFNMRMSLPNKFFEYIQGRLALAIGPSHEMSRMVDEYKIGTISDDFSPQSLAASISSLSIEDIEEYKGNSHKYAKELSSIANKDLLNAVFCSLDGGDAEF